MRGRIVERATIGDGSVVSVGDKISYMHGNVPYEVASIFSHPNSKWEIIFAVEPERGIYMVSQALDCSVYVEPDTWDKLMADVRIEHCGDMKKAFLGTSDCAGMTCYQCMSNIMKAFIDRAEALLEVKP
jgi:hypothetical protein